MTKKQSQIIFIQVETRRILTSTTANFAKMVRLETCNELINTGEEFAFPVSVKTELSLPVETS